MKKLFLLVLASPVVVAASENGEDCLPGKIMIERDVGLFFTSDVLFFKAREDNLNYAIDSKTNEHISDGEAHHPHFEWNFGGRLGLGWNIPHDHWDLYLTWTYFRSSNSGHASKKGDGVLFVTRSNPAAIPFRATVDSARAHWKLLVNLFDAELGREIGMSKWLQLRPFVGVRGAWIDQNFDLD